MGRKLSSHCKHGHPMSGENIYICPNGRRHCITCRRNRLRKHKNLDVPLDAPAMDRRVLLAKARNARQYGHTTRTADELWDIYQSQSGNKRATCKQGHPRTKENSVFSWQRNVSNTPFVMVACRICQMLRRRELYWHGKTTVFNVGFSQGQTSKSEKDLLRERIGAAMFRFKTEGKESHGSD